MMSNQGMKIYVLLMIIGIFSIQIPIGAAVNPTINITMIDTFQARTAESLHISYDGTTILAGTQGASDSFATLIEIPGEFGGSLESNQIQETNFDTTQKIIDIDNNGTRYIVNSYLENKVYCFSNTSSLPIWTNEVDEQAYDIKISGNGDYAFYSHYISTGMRTVLVDMEDGSEYWHFDYASTLVVDLSFNGSRLIVSSWNGSLMCFSKDTNEIQWEFLNENLGTAYYLGISGDGSTVFVADILSDYIFVLEGETGELIWSGEIPFSFSDIAISHTGDEILVVTQYGYSAGNDIFFFNRDSMTAEWQIHFQANGGNAGITADGSIAVVADWDGNMMFIDCETGTLLVNQSSGDPGTSIQAAVSPTGNSAAMLTPSGILFTYRLEEQYNSSTLETKFYEPFLDPNNFLALGISAGVGLILGGLLIGIFRRKKY